MSETVTATGSVEEIAVLSLGSNLGDRAETLRSAVDDVRALDGVELTAVSQLVETPAMKPEGNTDPAPDYLNAAALVRTTLAPEALLDAVNAIEARHGRVREVRWGDRTLDIDIVTMGGRQQSSARLTLPHPGASVRAFVLVPWLEIEPDAELPGVGRIDRLLPHLDIDVRPFPTTELGGELTTESITEATR